ncbi:barstar family protein [Kribbella sp. NPDC050241]|uniref:barstar family protein n=1 Tax=Kribbella sp. NPDC050241 TaxID=3364115 RepID=UPI0037A85F65
MSDVLIDGRDVYSELDLHRILERQLEFGDYYGRNLAALRDRLLTDVPGPVRLIWTHSAVSRSRLGDELFTRITAVFEEVAQQDADFGWDERFEFRLE